MNVRMWECENFPAGANGVLKYFEIPSTINDVNIKYTENSEINLIHFLFLKYSLTNLIPVAFLINAKRLLYLEINHYFNNWVLIYILINS